MKRQSAPTARRTSLIGLALGCVAVLVAACAPPPSLGTVNTQTPQQPKWAVVRDPIVVNNGSSYFVLGASNPTMHVPAHEVLNLTTTYAAASAWNSNLFDAMPQKPDWAVDDIITSPTVAQFGSHFVMFFTAKRSAAPDSAHPECIGRAESDLVQGPYIPESEPYSCGLTGIHGAKDPSIFIGPNGGALLYAVFGGVTVSADSAIYVMILHSNGDNARDTYGFAGYWGYAILAPKLSFETFLGKPAMMYDLVTRTYVLTYSVGTPDTSSRTTGLARCALPTGLCVHAVNVWLGSGGTPARTGVSDLSFFDDINGNHRAAYASFATGDEGITNYLSSPHHYRAGSVATVNLGTTPTLGL